MKLALIPPFALSHEMLHTDYQLVLPECFRDEGYTQAVYKMRAIEKYSSVQPFIILDNGAAEGDAWHPLALQAVAREFRMNEIVVPDMLGDKDGTLDMLENYEDELSSDELREFQHMGVPQGQTFDDFMKCIGVFSEKEWITTIGVPRHMLQTLGDKFARAQLANWINQKFPSRFRVHFLGSSAQWLSEASMLQKACWWARGMDTSLPFYAAYHNIKVDDIDPPIIARPDSYFDLPDTAFASHLVEYNLGTLRRWLR